MHFFSFAVNPCCGYPCQNAGVCVRFSTDQYQCDCTGTGFYGDNCTVRKDINYRVINGSDEQIQHAFWQQYMLLTQLIAGLLICIITIYTLNMTNFDHFKKQTSQLWWVFHNCLLNEPMFFKKKNKTSILFFACS